MISKKIKIRKFSTSGLAVFIIFLNLLGSCTPTKYVAENQYLVDKVEIKKQKEALEKEELRKYLKQQPNKRVLGFRFHLSLYNLSDIEKNNWFNNWLRKIGEEPVIYDEFQTDKTVRQLSLYLKNKGYYYNKVTDSVFLKDKRAEIVYRIEANKPYTIQNINYFFEDTGLRSLVLRDTVNSMIEPGNLFDAELLQDERARIEELLRNKGYYKFSKEFIYFDADTTVGNFKVDLRMNLKSYIRINEFDQGVSMPHPRFYINNVYINSGYQRRSSIAEGASEVLSLDTVAYDSIFLIHAQKPIAKKNVLIQSNYIEPGNLYQNIDVEDTYKHFSSLRLFRFINIQFDEVNEIPTTGKNLLNCNIQLVPAKLQSYSFDVEGTNSSGNIGAAGNLTYSHNNLFAGAEIFDFRIRGAIETLKKRNSNELNKVIELGAEANLKIPKFLVPFRTERFIKKFNPKTSMIVAYNYQNRPGFYTRTISNASFGYTWRGNKYLTHALYPIEQNIVKIHDINSSFQEEIQSSILWYSYQSHHVSVSSYHLVYSNQKIGRNTDFTFFKFNIESAGNLLYSYHQMVNQNMVDSTYQLFGTDYAQYMKGDFDLRYYMALNNTDKLVYRFFAGAAYPYGNSQAVPFEKKYFTGGANGIRAWQVRDLGPGSFSPVERGPYPNQTGDIKIEANVEYRFKLFWLLEGALFLDLGNIWSILPYDNQPGALFELNSFYNQMAVGTGFGTRFDFSFFIFRLDMGMKLKDPSLPLGERWILGNYPLNKKHFAFHIGIGYPF